MYMPDVFFFFGLISVQQNHKSGRFAHGGLSFGAALVFDVFLLNVSV